MGKHYEFVTVEGINTGCTHAEVGKPFPVTDWEIRNQDFAPGMMEECTRCGATRYLKEEETKMSNSDNTGRIETLACFSDHALSMMCNEGYRDDNDVLWTATAEEVAAVEAHREAKYQEWLISNPVAELESYVESDVISEVVVRVFGGNSHPARVEAATDFLEDFTAYQSNPVVIDSYETAAKTTESGAAYVQFRYFAS